MRPQAMLEAKDLAKCDLSNYLTERLDSVLERDRALRAERDSCPLEAVSLCKNLPCMACWWGDAGLWRPMASLPHAPLRDAFDGSLGFNILSSTGTVKYCTCGTAMSLQATSLTCSCVMSKRSIAWNLLSLIMVAGAHGNWADGQGHQQCGEEDGREAQVP